MYAISLNYFIDWERKGTF